MKGPCEARTDEGNIKARMFGRCITTRTPLSPAPMPNTVKLATQTLAIGLDYPLDEIPYHFVRPNMDHTFTEALKSGLY